MLTHVAIRFQGKVWALPASDRHHHVIRHIAEQAKVDHVDSCDDNQGFLDESGTYYDRRDALQHALRHEQVKKPGQIRGNELFSEDVW